MSSKALLYFVVAVSAVYAQPSPPLRSLTSVRDIEQKCEVAFQWLESGKSSSSAVRANNPRARYAPSLLPIFRDEPMTAVFGTPYDRMDAATRLDIYDKVLSRCAGLTDSRGRNSGGRPNAAMTQHIVAFSPYMNLIRDAFLSPGAGGGGQYAPAVVGRYLAEVREQSAWAAQTLSFAASAPATLDAFQQLHTQRDSIAAKTQWLDSAERTRLTDAIARRQSDIAPQIVDSWLRDANAAPKNLTSARALYTARSSTMLPVVRTLPAAGQADFERRYNALLDTHLAQPLAADLARLNAIPATLAGALQLTGWKSAFDAGFQQLRQHPSVANAEIEFQRTRARVYSGALPAWMQAVNAIPVDGAAITAKRRELEAFFPTRDDRALPQFAQFESPLRAKEDQLRIRAEADLQRQATAATAAPAPPSRVPANNATPATGGRTRIAPSAALNASSLNVAGLQNATFFSNIYKGDFANIGLTSDDMTFADLFSGYLTSFGKHCKAYLPQDTMVPIMKQICTAEWVDGYGNRKSCAEWKSVPTGYYADPELYAVRQKLNRQAAGDTLRNVGKMLLRKEAAIGDMMAMAGNAVAFSNDLDAIVPQNGCPSAALLRLEQNLRQFALNKPPIRMGELGPKLSAIDPLPGMPFRDQDYPRLLEDLIAAHSRSWAMNRYIRGSAAGVSVTARDAQGRPAKIVASYRYNGFQNGAQGSVTLTFTEGMPECMYFFDFPATCRTPDRGIAAAYSNGGYSPR
ncbi:hypothetical protein F183_A08370 [Bryobacterales bacterium F-183]|nr:hypothetical protein F183_A08370 [Bryobacterales bacterium F-183]